MTTDEMFAALPKKHQPILVTLVSEAYDKLKLRSRHRLGEDCPRLLYLDWSTNDLDCLYSSDPLVPHELAPEDIVSIESFEADRFFVEWVMKMRKRLAESYEDDAMITGLDAGKLVLGF